MIRKLYYNMRPMLPRWLQIQLRRSYVLQKRSVYQQIWPIDERAGSQPENWQGWPNGKKFAFVLTHDIERHEGQNRSWPLIEIEKKLGFKSAFYIVPERYPVSHELRKQLLESDFEVGVHGLNHDGKLFKNISIFHDRAIKINRYLDDWRAVGFRSPAMHHNLSWIHHLNIEYDASTFDTDPFEPQPDGVGTIFPFCVKHESLNQDYIELPYTLPQDHTLFIIMKEKNINIWKNKLDWIVDKGGMVLLNTHPDYMNFTRGRLTIEEYPASYYENLLSYVKEKYEGQYWHALPRMIAKFWRNIENLV